MRRNDLLLTFLGGAHAGALAFAVALGLAGVFRLASLSARFRARVEHRRQLLRMGFVTSLVYVLIMFNPDRAGSPYPAWSAWCCSTLSSFTCSSSASTGSTVPGRFGATSVSSRCCWHLSSSRILGVSAFLVQPRLFAGGLQHPGTIGRCRRRGRTFRPDPGHQCPALPSSCLLARNCCWPAKTHPPTCCIRCATGG